MTKLLENNGWKLTENGPKLHGPSQSVGFLFKRKDMEHLIEIDVMFFELFEVDEGKDEIYPYITNNITSILHSESSEDFLDRLEDWIQEYLMEEEMSDRSYNNR